jgi:putative flavoprotein involved in K+ transport
MTELDVIVIGAGHAGLSASFHLEKLHLKHLVLEKDRIGATWRNQRWDSFRLNTPNEINILPGNAHHFIDKEGFSSAPEWVSFLERYADFNRLPVQENSKVLSVVRLSGSKDFQVNISRSDQLQTYSCRQIVVASGGQNVKSLPPFAANLPTNLFQIHSEEYKNPAQIPVGAVLVVGCAQSGIQIAEELVQSGKKVFLSTCQVGRMPRRYRGKDILHWLFPMGFYETLTTEISDPKLLKVRQPHISGVGEKGHTVSLQFLARSGAVILGKISDFESGIFHIQSNAADNIRFADLISGQTKIMVDRYIEKMNLEAPLPEMDSADLPDPDCTAASDITELKLSDHHISAVIWATGFKGDFSFLHLPLLDQEGNPKHADGISETEGLYFIGLPWMRCRKSGIIPGIRDDAAFISEKIEAYHRAYRSASY